MGLVLSTGALFLILSFGIEAPAKAEVMAFHGRQAGDELCLGSFGHSIEVRARKLIPLNIGIGLKNDKKVLAGESLNLSDGAGPHYFRLNDTIFETNPKNRKLLEIFVPYPRWRELQSRSTLYAIGRLPGNYTGLTFFYDYLQWKASYENIQAPKEISNVREEIKKLNSKNGVRFGYFFESPIGSSHAETFLGHFEDREVENEMKSLAGRRYSTIRYFKSLFDGGVTHQLIALGFAPLEGSTTWWRAEIPMALASDRPTEAVVRVPLLAKVNPGASTLAEVDLYTAQLGKPVSRMIEDLR